MQCTEEGIWTIDVAGSRTDTPGRCKVYLSSYEGKLLREIAPEGTGPSGLGVDADNRSMSTVEHMFPTVGYRPHGVGIAPVCRVKI